MTRAERIFAAVLLVGLPLALLLPPEVVEFVVSAQVVILGVAAMLAGHYIWRVARGIARGASEYLWLLIRRDLRVAGALAMLAALAIVALLPRVLDWQPIISRPWGTVWLVVILDLLAIGLIDDALVMRADRAIVATDTAPVDRTGEGIAE